MGDYLLSFKEGWMHQTDVNKDLDTYFTKLKNSSFPQVSGKAELSIKMLAAGWLWK